MKTYQIHFIRHGITDGNLAGQYIGSTDLPLCDAGRKALSALADKYDYPGAGAFITSPMKRCTESLRILYPDAKQIEIGELRECDFGEFEGRTADELRDCKDFADWIKAPADLAPPSGESGEHFSARVCPAFEQIVGGLLKTGTTSAVIMTHGGVISMLLSRYGLPKGEPSEWVAAPGEGFTVRVHPQLWMTGQVMEVCSRLPYERSTPDDED